LGNHRHRLRTSSSLKCQGGKAIEVPSSNLECFLWSNGSEFVQLLAQEGPITNVVCPTAAFETFLYMLLKGTTIV
jgi:hypothetical protein